MLSAFEKSDEDEVGEQCNRSMQVASYLLQHAT